MIALSDMIARAFRPARDGPDALARLFDDGRAARDRGAWAAAERRFQRALAMARRIGARRETADAMFILSGLRLMERDLSASRRFAAQAAEIYLEIDERALAMRAGKLAMTATALRR